VTNVVQSAGIKAEYGERRGSNADARLVGGINSIC
jgi:hypothetical protein